MATRASTEQKLLDAADHLLFRHGIAATSVDAVLERAGVSPATLYRAYGSKDGLLVAALERRHRAWLATWDEAVARAEDDAGRLLAVLDALEEFRARPDGARWCAFLASAAEYADPPAPLAAALRLDSAALHERLRTLALPVVDGDRARADRLADALLLVVSGELAMHLREGYDRSGTARRVAEALVRASQAG